MHHLCSLWKLEVILVMRVEGLVEGFPRRLIQSFRVRSLVGCQREFSVFRESQKKSKLKGLSVKSSIQIKVILDRTHLSGMIILHDQIHRGNEAEYKNSVVSMFDRNPVLRNVSSFWASDRGGLAVFRFSICSIRAEEAGERSKIHHLVGSCSSAVPLASPMLPGYLGSHANGSFSGIGTLELIQSAYDVSVPALLTNTVEISLLTSSYEKVSCCAVTDERDDVLVQTLVYHHEPNLLSSHQLTVSNIYNSLPTAVSEGLSSCIKSTTRMYTQPGASNMLTGHEARGHNP